MLARAPSSSEIHARGWRGGVAWRDRVAHASAWLREEFPGLDAIVKAHSFERFEALAATQRQTNYLIVPPELTAFMRGVPVAFDAPYLCALLLWQMGNFDGRFAATGLDPEFAPHYADSFHRIIDQITSNPEFAALSRDSFLKDLWITRVVMIPAFAQVWWPRSGLSLRQLMRGGLGALSHAYLRCGGRRPFLEGHTHDPMVIQGYWNSEGWRESLRLAALALRAFAKHRGVFSTAWYFDPAVEGISPRLTFLSDLQASSGAKRFRVGTNAAAVANAIAKSPTRRRLHAEGAYTPTDYSIVWARRDLFAAYG